MTTTDIAAGSIGMGLIATLALVLRGGDLPRLGAALGSLALFELSLSLFLLPALADANTPHWLIGWEMLTLPALPILLRRYLDGLTETPLTRRDWIWALAPSVLLLPFLSLAPDVRQALLAGQTPNLSPTSLLMAVTSVGLFWLAWLAVTIASAVIIFSRLRTHRTRIAALYSTKGRGDLQGFALTAALLAVILCIQISDMITAGFGFDLLSESAGDVFSAVVILSLAAHGLSTRPPLPEWADEVLSASSEEPVLLTAALQPENTENDASVRPAYARSGLSDVDLDRILMRLDQAMNQQRLWTEPLLTLKDLAEAASVRPGYLSQALNQRRGISFFDYVNGWRIEAACALLSKSDKTILAIAHEVGFNAKSTFHTAFRKATGMNPAHGGPLNQMSPRAHQPECV